MLFRSNIIESLIRSLHYNYKWVLGNKLNISTKYRYFDKDELTPEHEFAPLFRSGRKEFIFGVDIPFIIKDMTKDYTIESKININFSNDDDKRKQIICGQEDKLVLFDKFKTVLKPFLEKITKENTEDIIRDFLNINDISLICLKANLILNNAASIKFVNITNDKTCKQKIIDCDFGANCIENSDKLGAGCRFDDMLLYDLKKTSTYHICSIFEDIYKNKNSLTNHIFALNYNIRHKSFTFDKTKPESRSLVTSLYSNSLVSTLDEEFGTESNVKLSEHISPDIFFAYLTYHYRSAEYTSELQSH